MELQKVKKRKIIIEDVVTKDPDRMEPCFVQFSNGTTRKPDELKGMLFRNNSEKYLRLRKQRILKVSSPHLSYIGKNFGDEAANETKERLFLGILNNETNKMELVELSTFLLHPNVKDELSKETLVVDNSQLSLQEQKKLLSQSFGGRRGRAMIKKMDENKLNLEDMENVLDTVLDKVVTDVSLDDIKIANNYEYLLPPCNKKANVIEDVYLLEDIITDDELIYFNETAVEYLELEELPESMTPLFGESLVNAKLLFTTESEKAKHICISLYLEQLVRLFRAQMYKAKSDDKLFLKECPLPLKEKVLGFILDGKKRAKSKMMEDKLIAHIIILALLSNKYELTWKALSSSLGIKKERLDNIIKVVGATFYRETGIIKLKLPLQKLPIPHRKKKKSS